MRERRKSSDLQDNLIRDHGKITVIEKFQKFMRQELSRENIMPFSDVERHALKMTDYKIWRKTGNEIKEKEKKNVQSNIQVTYEVSEVFPLRSSPPTTTLKTHGTLRAYFHYSYHVVSIVARAFLSSIVLAASSPSRR